MLYILVVCLFNLQPSDGTLCYNGTLSFRHFGEDPLTAPPLFSSARDRARLRCALTVKCDENAMCFVRSWSARGVHAWIVQRGCYSPPSTDPLLREMVTPTRAMTCKEERLPEAEYKVCLCKADWCNSAMHDKYHTRRTQFILLSSTVLVLRVGILDV
ncbi:uncharacterized protein LOC121737696 [Aricia agestis]|uniref:uncharacterized protein LOC121737696 n=1 Tax=Aricia agestis TaxID=91739 RepID=UPI001C205896|nr:uncharacterized protein LOC121737696 [Aricia agestis]